MSGWEPIKLGTAVSLVMGQAPAASDCNKKGYGAPFVKVGEFGAERPVIREWTTDPKKIARRSDVLICVVGATCGKINLGIDAAIGRSVAAIRPDPDKIDQHYLWYFMQGKVQEMRSGSQGAAQTVISREMINDVAIPLPPLEEQRRIVAVLDEAFAAIAQATANAEKNLANARELFERILQDLFTERGPNWIEEPLNRNVRFIDYRGKTPPKRETGIRLITAKNVKMGYIRRAPEEFIDPAAYDDWMTRGFPSKGDVLFTTEAPLGNVAQLDTDEKVVIGQRLITMQPKADRIDGTFLKYMLCSAPLQEAILKQATGATVLGIKASLLKLIPIFYPPSLSDQHEIVAKLDSAYELSQSMAEQYRSKINALAELKQSLLHRAFTGELTAKPELALA